MTSFKFYEFQEFLDEWGTRD